MFAPVFKTNDGINLDFFVFLTGDKCIDKNVKAVTKAHIEKALRQQDYSIAVNNCLVTQFNFKIIYFLNNKQLINKF